MDTRASRSEGEGDPYDDVLCFWSSLGIDEEICPLLAELDLIWADGRLLVRESCGADENVYDKVITCFMDVMRFIPFSESRWIGSTNPCARLIATECLGLASSPDRC